MNKGGPHPAGDVQSGDLGRIMEEYRQHIPAGTEGAPKVGGLFGGGEGKGATQWLSPGIL
jgi:hypothetical protein